MLIFRFCRIKRLRVFLLSLDGMLVHHRVTPILNSSVSTHTPGWKTNWPKNNPTCNIYSDIFLYRECYHGKAIQGLFLFCSVTLEQLNHHWVTYHLPRLTEQPTQYISGLKMWYVYYPRTVSDKACTTIHNYTISQSTTWNVNPWGIRWSRAVIKFLSHLLPWSSCP